MSDLEKELECAVCKELFVTPTLLSCGHMFCQECVRLWRQQEDTCPYCRTVIKGSVVWKGGEVAVDAAAALLPQDSQERRRAAKGRRGQQQEELQAKRVRTDEEVPLENTVPVLTDKNQS